LLFASCGGNIKPGSGSNVSNIKFRAFVSQNVSSSTSLAGLDIVDASLDRLARAPGVSAGGAPGLMAVPNNKLLTLVFDSSNNSINVINNKQEASAGIIGLPSWTESMAVTSDASAGYAAVLNAAVPGQSTGVVEMLNLTAPRLEAPIPVPAVRYVVLSPDNTRVLAFSENQNMVTVISATNTGTTSSPVWVVNTAPVQVTGPGLDRPVWGVFSPDSTTAYIMNCGPECGGSSAGVTVLDMTTNPPTVGGTLNLPGATQGVLFGTTLYVAGTAPSGAGSCSTTTVNTCGTLSIINVSNPAALQLISTQSITDGYHNRMAVTADNQVFVGARNCTNVNIPANGSNPAVQFGCLSLFNPASNKVIIGTDLGDVTGIQPVTGRTQVYVVQAGELRIWDTSKDALTPAQIDLIGNAVDVKIVD
jgi:hypothetical protein